MGQEQLESCEAFEGGFPLSQPLHHPYLGAATVLRSRNPSRAVLRISLPPITTVELAKLRRAFEQIERRPFAVVEPDRMLCSEEE